MKDDTIYNSWTEFITSDKYKKYFLSNKEEWYQKLSELKNYIDINNKRPLKYDEIENIKIMGLWLSTQIKTSKKRYQIMKDNDIYKSWSDFITSDKYKKYFKRCQLKL